MKMLLRTSLFLLMLTMTITGFAQAPVTAADAAKANAASAEKAATPKVKGGKKNKKTQTAATATTPAATPTPAALVGADPTKNADGTPASSPVAPTQPASATPAGTGNGGAGITFNAPSATDVAPVMEAPATPLTTVSFSEVTFDFGKIKQGETVKHKFTITNTGTNPLILENVKPSCGCTALDWPKDPIAPGKSGEIEAQFNSTGKSGAQLKNITITLNTAEHLERLTFTGEVIAPPVDPNAPADGATPSGGH